MKLTRKLALGAALAVMAGLPVLAANVPNMPSTSQINEPSQEVASLNALIATLNSLWTGQVAALPAPIVTSGTTANTVIASNVVLQVGQAVRVRVWGFNSADANAKTITVNYGSGPTAAALAVTGSGANWWVDCLLQNGGTVALPKVNAICYGAQAATLITPTLATDTTDIAPNSQAINVTATAATSGTITVAGAWIEYVR